jgi:hypothetical protein
MNYLPRLTSNCDPPDLCLLSSQDYRREPLVPSLTEFCFCFFFFLTEFLRLVLHARLWASHEG